MEIKELNKQAVLDYLAKHKEAKEWAKEVINKKVIDKEGNERDITFVEFRALFVDKYFPNIRKAPKKAETFIDLINKM